jgi:Fe-S-cluster containining protein
MPRLLSLHARYGCRHSGACCTSHWPIPVEGPVHERLAAALRDGRLTPPGDPAEVLVPRGDLPADYASVLAQRSDGACVFFDRASQRCAIHRSLGADAKPVSCRAFPLVIVDDPRGMSVSLSHYCPSAADLLFDPAPLEIVERPGLFEAFATQGLDARAGLPPLLEAGVLLDWETLEVWERFVVAALAAAGTPEAALRHVEAGRLFLQRWSVSSGPLVRHARGLFRTEAPAALVMQPAPTPASICTAIPPALRPTAPTAAAEREHAWQRFAAPEWPRFSAPVRRYLAARAMASWPLYQRGLDSHAQYLRAALEILKWQAGEAAAAAGRLDEASLQLAIRRTDLILLHLASPEALVGVLDGAAARPRPTARRFS